MLKHISTHITQLQSLHSFQSLFSVCTAVLVQYAVCEYDQLVTLFSRTLTSALNVACEGAIVYLLNIHWVTLDGAALTLTVMLYGYDKTFNFSYLKQTSIYLHATITYCF